MERSSFLYITLILMKRIQFTIPCFHERASSYFSCLKLHDFTQFKTKIYWGGPPDPSPTRRHGYYIKLPCDLCVCVKRGLQLYKRPCPTGKKKLVYMSIIVWKVNYVCRRGRTTTTLRFFFRFLPYSFFLLV